MVAVIMEVAGLDFPTAVRVSHVLCRLQAGEGPPAAADEAGASSDGQAEEAAQPVADGAQSEEPQQAEEEARRALKSSPAVVVLEVCGF